MHNSLRTFDSYSPINFKIQSNENEIEYFEKPKDVILLNNVLTNEECDNLIQEGNNYGFRNMSKEYPENVRNNKRLLFKNSNLANHLWNKIFPFIDNDKFKNIRPYGFGVLGYWIPSGINECFRFSKYEENKTGFLPHRDACYIKNLNERSILTLILYLNDDFEGGSTNFYQINNTKRIAGKTVAEEMINSHTLFYTYQPQKGSALIFNHNMIHEGAMVSKGHKYILRTDIIYKRQTKFPTYEYWYNNPHFITAVKLYREAGNQELAGNVEKASKLYERGLSYRQCNQI